MTIEHCDNFSIYGGDIARLLDGVYAINSFVGLQADPDGISPGYVLATGAVGTLEYILSETQPIVGMAFRIWAAGFPEGNGAFHKPFYFNDVGNGQVGYLFDTPTGALGVTVIRGETYQTEGPVFTTNAWWHIEVKINVTLATFEVRVEGVTVLTGSAAPNFDANIAIVGIGSQYDGNPLPSAYYKDVVFWNGAGTQNNDFLGSVLVTTLLPVADVSLNWTPTPNTDTGAEILATVPPQDGVVYLAAPNPPPAPYVGTFAQLNGDITSVKCVMSMVRASKIDGGDGSLQVGLISSPDNAPETTLGANRPITTAQTYWRDVFELDPKTAAEWLPNGVNLAQLQINRTA